MRRILAALLAAVSVPAAGQEAIAITGGKVITNAGAPIEGGTVLMNDGVVIAVEAGGVVPAGYRQVDATGKWVTPGIIAGISQLGTAEVHGDESANDQSAKDSPATAALMLEAAYNPSETAIPVTRHAGVTTAVVAPNAGRTLFAGQGYLLSLADGTKEPFRPRAFQYVAYGEQGARLAGGSRPAAWAELTNAREEARRVQQGR
ncbi:MAG: amidohydrolase, partial [Sandaracinobacteroides sp.]